MGTKQKRLWLVWGCNYCGDYETKKVKASATETPEEVANKSGLQEVIWVHLVEKSWTLKRVYEAFEEKQK